MRRVRVAGAAAARLTPGAAVATARQVPARLPACPPARRLPCSYPGQPDGGVISFVGAHMDVVTANPDSWSFDPFKLTRRVRGAWGGELPQTGVWRHTPWAHTAAVACGAPQGGRAPEQWAGVGRPAWPTRLQSPVGAAGRATN
jgi:hypothetical protein